jgi:hypothetical protein
LGFQLHKFGKRNTDIGNILHFQSSDIKADSHRLRKGKHQQTHTLVNGVVEERWFNRISCEISGIQRSAIRNTNNLHSVAGVIRQCICSKRKKGSGVIFRKACFVTELKIIMQTEFNFNRVRSRSQIGSAVNQRIGLRGPIRHASALKGNIIWSKRCRIDGIIEIHGQQLAALRQVKVKRIAF